MKILYLFLFISSFVQATTIVSGLDDVLRHANNHHFLKAAWKLVSEEDRPYTGMAEVYQELHPTHFYVLSGMPHWFTGRIELFLKQEKFPDGKVNLRNVLKDWSAPSFKIDFMQELIKSQPEEKFIFVFDNSEDSVKTAEIFYKEFPQKILAIYFRMTVTRAIPSDAKPILTSFDMAYEELKWNRLSPESAEKIGELILQEKNFENLIPSYADCPANYVACGGTKILKSCALIEEKIQTLCKPRSTK